MHKVSFGGKTVYAKDNALLSDVLNTEMSGVEHLCGGLGKCGKCAVIVDGKRELSCRYRITRDISVVVQKKEEITSDIGVTKAQAESDNVCFALDIGTTTLALACLSQNDGKIIDVKTCTNPQRSYGADVISRIDYATKNGTEVLQEILISSVNDLLALFEVDKKTDLYVSGNATMLHIFFGVSPEAMGKAPYTPAFVGQKTESGEKLGLKNIEKVLSLPSVSAFVGADIVAGLNFVGMPPEDKHNILIDLGTNAEIVLYSSENSLCTAAAAGPCFEGANISCGMSAVSGAVYSYSEDGAKTINNVECRGICGTGLIDIIAFLLRTKKIDNTGFMEEEEFVVSDGVYITRTDIRQYQLAKSAVYSAIETLMKKKNVSSYDIDKVYISGGFSAKINIENAAYTGLLPKELADKCVSVNNSSLLGTVKYAYEKNDLSVYIKNTEYVDLSLDTSFSDLFIKNMMF